jgi:hypothetical protein
MPPWQDVYGKEAKEFAVQLFQDGLKAVEVVERMRVKYPSFTRQTLSYWAIHDPDGFGVVYRNSIATVAQRTLANTFDQLEDIYEQTQATVGKEEIDPAVFTGLRLMADISKNQQTGALLTLARIAKKHYGDNIKVDAKTEVSGSLQVDTSPLQKLTIEELTQIEASIKKQENADHHNGG